MAEVSEFETVFTNPTEFNAFHPLHNEWTLWYDNPGKKINQSTWTQNLKSIVTVKTVEDFWGVMNNVYPANEIPLGANYHMFKSGIKPMWEDPANAKGGKWSVTFSRAQGDRINDIWINSILGIIGENYPHPEEICGIVFSNRKICFRFGLWLKSFSDPSVVEAIGLKFKELLGDNIDKVEFQVHHSDNGQSLNLVL
ncbi:Eukaryotic translation initiation factor 4E [Smittium mucronatum]|uniref:Eukaryotic translation initiation factor 4E n=1 Tax=Smittium mucronatum TaxID=133383 RepID=A0A1R0H5M9_9FUNG|nr:Eukaryotic translation initiation factor 4E [Smittium mucronatum]